MQFQEALPLVAQSTVEFKALESRLNNCYIDPHRFVARACCAVIVYCLLKWNKLYDNNMTFRR
jgi:hypothetical protein